MDSPISIDLFPVFDGDNIVATASITAGDQGIDGNFRIHFAMVSNYWDDFRGGNGQDEWWSDLLDLAPDQTFSIEANETVEYEAAFDWPFELSGNELGIENISVIVFVQNGGTDEVLQSAQELIDITVPMLAYSSCSFSDDGQWRPNDRPDAGETVQMTVNLEALEVYEAAYNITGVLSCDDDDLTITEANGSWDDILPGETANNSDAPFTVSIPEGYEPKFVNFSLALTADDFERTVQFEALMGVPDLLLVNDYGSGDDQSDIWWNIFEATGFVADFSDGDFVEALELDEYGTVIWATAASSDPGELLTEDEIASITGFLDNGGLLLLTSQYAGETVGGEDWFHTYFAADHDIDAIPNPGGFGAQGIPDGVLPEAFMALIGAGGAGNSVSPSSMTVLDGGTPLYTYMNVEDIAGVMHEADTYQTVYLGFPLESISPSAGSQSADEVLIDLLGLLGSSVGVADGITETGFPSTITVTPYPNPFNSTLTVTYSLPSAGNIQLEVLNILGQRVALLKKGQSSAGIHSAVWQAENRTSGLYFIRLETTQETRTAKALLVK